MTMPGPQGSSADPGRADVNSSAARSPEHDNTTPRVYVASKSRYGGQWRALRDEYAHAVTITATWIDESEPGQTADQADLWRRCISEAAAADALVAVHNVGETWKGAYVEIGAALAAGKPVFYVGDPPGSWINHPLVERCADLDEALSAAACVVEDPQPEWAVRATAAGRATADPGWDSEKVCGLCEVAGHDFATCPRRRATADTDPPPDVERLRAMVAEWRQDAAKSVVVDSPLGWIAAGINACANRLDAALGASGDHPAEPERPHGLRRVAEAMASGGLSEIFRPPAAGAAGVQPSPGPGEGNET